MPDLPERKRLRLQGYDYSQTGAYFVTIVTHGRAMAFGVVVGDEMILNPAGEMVQAVWARLPERFPTIALDEFIVMPNHVHGIVWLRDDDMITANRRGRPSAEGGVSARKTIDKPAGAGRHTPDGVVVPYDGVTLGDVIRSFKVTTTRQYSKGVRQHGWLPFDGKLWQRGYHDRVIRTDKELDDARVYVRFNAQKWSEDAENR